MKSSQVNYGRLSQTKHVQSNEMRSGQTKAGQVDHQPLLEALSDMNCLW